MTEHCVNGTNMLSNSTRIADGDGEFHAMTTDFVDFMTGAATVGRTDTANVKQAIEESDASGSYNIILTFTGAFV
jgi:hypothetical protein